MDSIETRVVICWEMEVYRDWIKRTEKQQGQHSSLGVFLCNSKLRGSFGYIFLLCHTKLVEGNVKETREASPWWEPKAKRVSGITCSWKSNSKKAQYLSIIIIMIINFVMPPASLLSSVWFQAEDVERQCGLMFASLQMSNWNHSPFHFFISFHD